MRGLCIGITAGFTGGAVGTGDGYYATFAVIFAFAALDLMLHGKEYERDWWEWRHRR